MTLTNMPTPTSQILEHMICESMGLYYPIEKGKSPRAGKKRQLAAEPLGWLDGSQNECWPVVSTFHFLRDRLEYDRDASQGLYRFHLDGNTIDENLIYRWANALDLGEAFVGSTLDDAHSLDHDFGWWVFDDDDDDDLLAVVQTCDELAVSRSHLYVFRIEQLEDLLDFRRAIVHCSGSLALPPEDDDGRHVFEFTGDEWEEYLVTNEGWHPNNHDDDPFTNVQWRGESELPIDPAGVIHYDKDWKMYHCPRCAGELDVEGPSA